MVLFRAIVFSSLLVKRSAHLLFSTVLSTADDRLSTLAFPHWPFHTDRIVAYLVVYIHQASARPTGQNEGSGSVSGLYTDSGAHKPGAE